MLTKFSRVISSYPKTVHVGSSARNLPLSADLDTSGVGTGGGDGGSSGDNTSSAGSSSAYSTTVSYTSTGGGYSYQTDPAEPTTMSTGYGAPGGHGPPGYPSTMKGGWGPPDHHDKPGNWGPPAYKSHAA